MSVMLRATNEVALLLSVSAVTLRSTQMSSLLQRCTVADSVRRIFPMLVAESVRSADHPFDAVAEYNCPVVLVNVSVRSPDVKVGYSRVFRVLVAVRRKCTKASNRRLILKSILYWLRTTSRQSEAGGTI